MADRDPGRVTADVNWRDVARLVLTSREMDRLEEQLEIITGLWATPLGRTFDFQGKHYQITDSPGLPKPVQAPRPPVIARLRTPIIASHRINKVATVPRR